VIALGLGAGWALVVLLIAGPHRHPARVPGPYSRADGATAVAGGTSSAGQLAAGPTWLGAAVRRWAGRPTDADADRRAGWAIVATGALLAIAPALSLLPAVWSLVAPALAARRSARVHEAAVVDQLPDVVDLVALTTSAGLPVTAAFGAIGSRPGGPLGAGLAAAAAHAARGGTAAEALALVARTSGPAVRPLVDALAEHDRYGTPLRPSLQRVGIEARLRRRRQAEEAARRLPITLLFPLVLTTFPAFVLLTVIPLLAGSFGSLSP
jgi:Flp pilus assembly protein TadB